MSKNTFYVTTPIYYVTAKPHLGHLYSTVLADVAARWHSLAGQETFLLTGTDEHGQKIEQAAGKAGKQPQEFVDSFVEPYKNLWRDFDIEYSYFIRTTDDQHKQAVQDWIELLIKKGDIYKAEYSCWYCTPCETFLNEKASAELQQGPLCPSCNRATQHVAEEAYFFRLSAYQDRLLAHYKNHPDFVLPSERLQEVISFVEGGLRDLCISRTTVQWGIPFKHDPKHVTYVWADALNNYITAIGYLQAGKESEFARWWPASLQVMGKDIIRFHAVYWPAFLMASDLPLPQHLLVHGWFLVNQQKMSKSFGNVMDPELLLRLYGADAVRYYLTAYMAINHDSEFSLEDLEHRVSGDLANEIGNLLNRVLALAKQHQVTTLQVTDYAEISLALKAASKRAIAACIDGMSTYHFHKAYGELKRFTALVNAYVNAREPWRQAKNDMAAFQETLAAVCHSLETIGVLLWPVMPRKMSQLLIALDRHVTHGINHISRLEADDWTQPRTITIISPLFEKIEGKHLMQENQPVEKVITPAVEEIEFDVFAQSHLVVCTILEAQKLEKSDKLLKLQVECGEYGKRQILSGIAQHFSPEELVGKQAVFVLNLKPRKMMGMESQGMLLTAQNAEGKLVLVKPEHAVVAGVRLK